MNRNAWITLVVVAIAFAGGGYYAGTKSAASQAPTSRLSGAGGTTFITRGAGGSFAGGGATIGTIVAVGSDSFTVQLPSSTSTGATTGTKLVLVNDSTQVQELQSVPSSNLQVGQTVTVAGAANSDGSVTASSVMIRPAAAGGRTGGAAQAPTGQ